MSTIQSPQQLDLPVTSDKACPKCGKEMRLAYIVPQQAGHDLYDFRTFECVDCDKSVTITLKC
jgi:hypothetical protein